MQIKKRITLLIILITALLSIVTFWLVFRYFDPYSNTILALATLITSFVLGISAMVCLFLYFFKKIYFRGEVYLFHVINSFRQGFFVSLFLVGIIVFTIMKASVIIASIALIMLFIFIEMFIQDIS